MEFPVVRKKRWSGNFWIIASALVGSRIVFTIVGSLARLRHWPFVNHWVLPGPLSSHVWLNVWGLWDSGWYFRIASEWYSSHNLLSFAFFPLYPGLTRLLGVGGHYFLAGLIISNVALIASCWLLYRLAGRGTRGVWAVLALLCFPAAFVLSGMFSEALYLCLALVIFYFAQQQHWWLVGIIGFLLSLSRPVGFLIALPMLVEYFQQRGWKLRAIDRSFWWLCLIPLGLPLWAWFNHHLTGDWLNFVHVEAAWHRSATNPISALWTALRANNWYDRALGLVSLATAALLVLFHRALRVSERVWGWLSLVVPLFTGIYSMPRYILVIFPLYLGFARTNLSWKWRLPMLLILAAIEFALFVYWPKPSSWVV